MVVGKSPTRKIERREQGLIERELSITVGHRIQEDEGNRENFLET